MLQFTQVCEILNEKLPPHEFYLTGTATECLVIAEYRCSWIVLFKIQYFDPCCAVSRLRIHLLGRDSWLLHLFYSLL